MKTRFAIMAIAAAVGAVALATLSMPAFADEPTSLVEDDLERAAGVARAVNADHCIVRQDQATLLWKAGQTDQALTAYGEIMRGHPGPHPFLQRQKSVAVSQSTVRTVDAGLREGGQAEQE